MLKNWIVLLLTTVFMLSACNSPVYNQTEGNVADITLKTSEARHRSDAMAKPQPSLLVKKGLYVDTTPVSIARDPLWLRNRIVIRGDQLPFSYYSRTIASGAGSNVLTKYQTGLDPAVNVTMNYSGTIKGALDLLATKTGYVYSVRGSLIYWQSFVTKTFDIAFMPGGTDYLMGKSSGGTGAATGGPAAGGTGGGQVSNYVSSDYSDSEYSNLKGTLSIWKDLDSTIRQLLSPEGKVMVSESTTSVTVRDRPTNVELIGQYIYNLNHNLSKQVLVKVQVLEIDLQSNYNFGIDWALISRAFNKSPFVFNANYGTPIVLSQTLSGSLTQPQIGLNPTQDPNPNKIPSYQILFNALNQQGKTSLVSEPRVVCLNNQVSVVRIVRSEGYAASIQNTTLGGGTTPSVNASNTVTSQITPGTVVTGLTLYILPKILKDKVYLQVNADLSTNDGFQNFGDVDSGSGIQLPRITSKHFNQRSMIRSGDTLILSGFRQVGNRANAMQFMESQAMGGKASAQLNRETIVLITPIILSGTSA
ncbi:type II secretion system protein GspD [Aquicella lusitana]|uniref:Type IVB pilus formation R64 PilN family outer membrane protein n=1 Tax=Aquicella lusitana TaxID=254246 RepID=A0A370GX96_9COXI|nr:hypothetical protein [Aquicella lusitana]RDI46533.1 type IVB pilus formation R64 PilN family outer membrane protein [Aquicella lusitana]VVC74197.1 Outer membrane lipoprotein BfpB [Aquicella lusitana]